MPNVIAEVTPKILQAFADAWNRHDVDALMSFMTEDCVFEASAGPDVCGTRYAGREAVRAGFAEVWATFPDARWGNARHFIRADRGMSEWTFTGTRADGTRVEVDGWDLLKKPFHAKSMYEESRAWNVEKCPKIGFPCRLVRRRKSMDEPPVFVIILIAASATLVAGFIYLGGTALILTSSWVPMRTRLQWVAFSVTPLALLVALTVIAAACVGTTTTAPGAGERFGDAFTPIGLMGGLVVVGVIAANWLIFRRFRAAFPRASESKIVSTPEPRDRP